MEKLFVYQDYNAYTAEDHQTWATLSKRQSAMCKHRASKEYLSGLSQLDLDIEKIIDIGKLSDQLESVSGWKLVPVGGLIPTRDFFYMLINKKYPVNVSIRKPHEIDFSEQPDIFHDVFGHLPLLTNENFIKYLTTYSIIALKYVNNDRAVDLLGRLYWYTYEMGIINEDGIYKPYGGAIITSSEEIANIDKVRIPKYSFDLGRIFETPYDPYKLQNEYFVINSFDDLFNSLEGLESKLIEHLLLPEEDHTIRNYSLNTNVSRNFKNVIGFLNDVQYEFPQAISLAAGQPDENYFDIEDSLSKFEVYVNWMMTQTGNTRKEVVNRIGQYSKTQGIVNGILAEYLKKDENINIEADKILVTAGAQEAFSIIVSTICNHDNDVIIVESPSYIGVSSFARIFNYNIAGVDIDEEGIDLGKLKQKILEINRMGKRVKLLYVIPDYQNPSGSCMPIGNRLKLLELANKYNFLIIEDSVYNSFTYCEKRISTLKSLDKYNRVIYVGSFSKLLFPGLRIGFIGASQHLENEYGIATPLVNEMTKVKASLTNNTCTISQAILAGVLLNLNYSLSEWNKPKFESYRNKKDQVINALNKYIGAFRNDWADGIKWNDPQGGFFIKMSLPFAVDRNSVFTCASKFHVIFCPMQYFYLDAGGENELRLTFSNLSLTQIDQGINRLAEYLKSQVIKLKDEQFPEFIAENRY